LKQALSGVKIADFTWVAAGSFVTRILADCGATVVKIESSSRPDPLRSEYPYAENIPGINRSATFATYNPNKYGIALNLNTSKGQDIARRLVKWADIVTENFSPGTMERWNLAYSDLVKSKPDIIMLSTNMQGSTGTYAKQPGFGNMLQALTGFTALLGWPDRGPVGTQLAYTDYIAPYYAAIAIVLALEHRQRFGEGQYIDQSQLEAGISFLSSPVLNYTVNKVIDGAMGNRCYYAAPHGAYRCQGNDRWCAIAIFTDEEWESLCKITGSRALTENRFATLLKRKQNEDELDRLIEQWTINHRAEDVVEILQSSGIAAGLVETGEDLHRDPQLKHRKHFWFMEHPEIGLVSSSAPPFRMTKTPPRPRLPAPCLGEHTKFVCTEFLQMSETEFTELEKEGVFR